MSRRRLRAPVPHGGLAGALRRVLPVATFGAVPVAVAASMLVVAVVSGPLAWDFQNELYPQAKELLDGRNPYPGALWPPLAAVVAMPLTALGPREAGVVVALVGLLCIALALWIVGVRDWRVYGLVGLWPPVLGDIRIAHLTPLLCLLAAVVWRYRDRPLVAGLALGAAGGLKFFLWPIGVWLLAERRANAAVVAVLVAAGSILLLVPLAPLADYVRTLRHVTDAFDQDSYSPYGLLTQLGAGELAARGGTYALGAGLLILTWRRRSFALAVAAALVLSPIVWLDFYALAVLPLAIARPTISAAWILPLATWGLPSSGIATDPVWGVARVLVTFAIVLLVAATSERVDASVTSRRAGTGGGRSTGEASRPERLSRIRGATSR